MRRFFHLMIVAVAAVCMVAGCQKYDDSELRRELQELREKLSSLEAWCSSSQSAIDAVSVLQKAVNDMNSVESIEPFIDSDGATGYVITFTNKQTIKLYNGQKGKDGDTFFGSVAVNDDCIIFTLADGRTFTVPRKQDEHNYLAFEAVEAGATVSLEIIGEVDAPSLEYSINKLDWTIYDFSNPQTITLKNVGDKVYWRNTGTTDKFSLPDDENFLHFNLGAKKIAASGNIMSLLDIYCEMDEMPDEAYFTRLFDSDTLLVSAPELPATKLSPACYYLMFRLCHSLKTAPELPATIMEPYCYFGMFAHCKSLKEAPALLAETLANDCYYEMFAGCSSLEKAPELPAVKVESECYVYMFTDCTSLVEAPALPATELDRFCYYGMFWKCSNLKNAPDLPAQELALYCYGSMFEECTSLETAPELPAKNLAEYCYYSMFWDCFNLKKTPELQATELTPYCYTFMFGNCSSLTETTALPATELADYCYAVMFGGCTSLEKAPELPAENLVLACYESLFEECEKIDHVKVGFTDWGDGYMTRYWLNGTASEGSFEGPEILEAKYGENYIPEGWTFNGRDPEVAAKSLAVPASCSSVEKPAIGAKHARRAMLKPELTGPEMISL